MNHSMDSPLSPPPPAYQDDTAGSVCPDYSTALFFRARALLKHEFDSPASPTVRRAWQKTDLELCGTRLALRKPSEEQPTVLSLQAAEVGLALDYRKRSHVLRLRVEGRQFLLAFNSLNACLEWYDRLEAAIAISMPLEDRHEPPMRTVPHRRPRLPPPLTRDCLRRTWREVWRKSSHKQAWINSSHAGESRDNGSISENQSAHVVARSLSCSSITTKDRECALREIRSCSTTQGSTDSTPRSSVSSEESEAGEHLDCYEDTGHVNCSESNDLSDMCGPGTWSTELEYARRCASVLLYGSEWKESWYYRCGEKVRIEPKQKPAFITTPVSV